MTPYATVKSGVDLNDIKPEMIQGLLICCAVYIHHGQNFVVTSGRDGKHMASSFHYKGLAVDLRIRDLKGMTAQEMAAKLREALGKHYDVVVEKDHIHVEYDFKS